METVPRAPGFTFFGSVVLPNFADGGLFFFGKVEVGYKVPGRRTTLVFVTPEDGRLAGGGGASVDKGVSVTVPNAIEPSP
ncbi:MAG TPA: hypothetical protein VMU77_04265 [Acidimicrobiales bacterium]|nr:hypothetical protein [Acidimicrobiales bacterium]